MPIQIIAIGKKHESWVFDGIARYQKRIQKPFEIEWAILPHSTHAEPRARLDESQHILKRLNAYDFVILLDERGKNIDSPGLSKLLLTPLQASRNIVVIIGGAYGVDDIIRQRADFVWSLSGLVFPHQLVRLMLIEQIYRAQEIAAGNPYHHN